MPPTIAIIGSGPSGLTLASLLQRSSISYTLFDLRSTPDSSALLVPSGSLDLHPESGLLALEACNLISQFETRAPSCSEDTILANKEGTVKYIHKGHGNRPEIARNELTSLLLSTIQKEDIRWGWKLFSVSPSQNSKWILEFEGKEKQEFDLVVGADGAWSKVRPALTDVKPHFSGINCITMTIPHITTKYPALATVVGKGTYNATGEKKGIMVQRGSMDSARIYLMLSSETESYLSNTGLATASAQDYKSRLLNDEALFSTWGKELKDLLSAGCELEIETEEEISAKPL